MGSERADRFAIFSVDFIQGDTWGHGLKRDGKGKVRVDSLRAFPFPEEISLLEGLTVAIKDGVSTHSAFCNDIPVKQAKVIL